MIKDILTERIKKAAASLSRKVDTGKIDVSHSERFGDYATNAAMVVASSLDEDPRELAEKIKEMLLTSSERGRYIKSIEIAGPGFINIMLTDEAILSKVGVLDNTLDLGLDLLGGQKVNIEFISANPTGELHIGHGRGAFYGDILSSVFSYAGADVVREFYINDSRESNQIKELGKTVLGEGEQYKTVRLEKIIAEMSFKKEDGTHSEALTEAGFELAEKVGEYNKDFIESKLGIKFDRWYSEDENIRASGAAEKILDELKAKDLVYEEDGAWWLKTSEYGDDEDRVVVRSDKTATYFLSDIAYHMDKFCRGYDSVIDVWGADHHGHVKRMMAVKKMLGWEGDFQIFITQMVSLKEGGKAAKMSKRAGNVVLLEDLVDDFGLDVVRWFFAEKSLGTHMEFDAELAKQQSQKNPVYYVQYAHARICSILEKARELEADNSSTSGIIKEERGRALAMKVTMFSEVVEGVTRDHQVHKLTTYAYELASEFNQFYRDVRVIKDDTYNRGALELAKLAKRTLAKTLSLLGISAPEKM